MINAVIAIELEGYLEHDGQIEVVHDKGLPKVSGLVNNPLKFHNN
ncbi:hypothetical protein NUK45_20345 [Aeromonas veronii]|nr:hypothetical protein [Aeromonas veronii]MCR3965313.1 hypothetical protein [Aeromonas veronii]